MYIKRKIINYIKRKVYEIRVLYANDQSNIEAKVDQVMLLNKSSISKITGVLTIRKIVKVA